MPIGGPAPAPQAPGAADDADDLPVASPASASRPRLPAVVQAVAATAILVLLAAVALTSRQDAPPSVAELAPQAVEQITEELEDQAPSEAEPGGAGGGAAASTTTTTASPDAPGTPGAAEEPPPIEVPRVRRCVGDPPRQTEDPQSPPCVPYFEGDNGGATWKGVTADEIVVAYPVISFGEDASAAFDLVSGFFNKRYELYGRKIRLVATNPRGGGFAQPNPPDMKADAIDVADTFGAFASIAYPDRKGAEHHYYDALGDLGVLSTAYRAQTIATEARYAARSPYQWNGMPSTDTMMRLLGGFICRSLEGRPARFAGPRPGPGGERSFGLLYQRTPDGTIPTIGVLEQAMAGCGASFAAKVEDQAGSTSNPQQAILAMSDAGVTSVICLCEIGALREGFMAAATSQAYQPEWLVSSLIDLDVDNTMHGAPPDQASRLFGVTFRDPLRPRTEMPWYWAFREAQPSRDISGGTTYSAMARYEQLALLAAGIQLAGPKLTPETFKAGLHKARFPNPGAGGPPYYLPRVGFPGGRHTMIDDAAVFWYSTSDPGTVDPAVPGAVCYVRRGARFTAATFPADDADLFRGPCRQ